MFGIYLNVIKERQRSERFDFYDFAKADYEQIALALSHVDWCRLFAVSSPDALWSNFISLLHEVAFKYIPMRTALGKCRRKKFYPTSIKNKLKTKHRAWVKMKHSCALQDKAHYKNIARECASLIYNYDRDREQAIVDSHSLGRFYRYINGKLSCKTGVGAMYAKVMVVLQSAIKKRLMN